MIFKAVMITLMISHADGSVREVSRQQYDTREECELHKRQKEFTTFVNPHTGDMPVFLCEWN